ncbi:sulfur carrier protein ThiS [Neotamlana laminarinivorans]|uniref:Sulfur carrier protein ThiS n=1 Tax=Neotamlana laminarinivorans TaxID=2883124 RepID=A0A9X1L2H3_9FLAO|nr:sulfur carrier protein ThiS [Tamlana laminarinivorans]MCB4799783.1 sulfur carrier protein ThiS [Tamlana laminarinivorans]
MYIKVNQTLRKIPDNLSVEQLVEHYNVSTNGIAVAINNEVIKKSNWSSTTIKNDDDIIIIKSTQGG